MNVLFLLSWLLTMGCSDINPPVEPPIITTPDTGLLSLQWELPIQPVGNAHSINEPLITPLGVVFRKVFGGPEDVVFCVDPITGERLWEWRDPDVPDGEQINTKVSTYSDSDGLYIGTSRELFGISLATGINEWKEVCQSGASFYDRMTVLGDHIYTSHHDPWPFQTGHLVRYPTSGGVFDTLFSAVSVAPGYDMYIEPPSLYVKSNGDSLLLFRLKQSNVSTNHGYWDFIAYNLASRNVEWRNDSLMTNGTNVRPFTVYDDKVYVMGGKIILCFDADTGEKLWEQQQDWGLMGSTSILVAEGKLIVKPNNSQMIAYDPTTGQQIWKVASSVVDANGMQYYNGHIFVTGAEPDIFVHRISDGKLVYRKSMKDRFGELYKPIAIDPEAGLLFTADKKNALCFKINL